jgi:NAD(P)-dependent dehydrogenase (short-subunit alcohol dehydrogenase family)
MTTKPIIAITDAGPLARAVASLFVSYGWRVAIYHIESLRENANGIVADLGANQTHSVAVDPAAGDSWQAAIDATRNHWGTYPQHAAIICDNWRGGGPLYMGGPDDGGVFRKVTVFNFEAVYRSMRVLLPSMVEAGFGSIVVVGSQLAERPWDGTGSAAYVAAKSASAALVQTAAQEVSAHGVRVNSVLITALDTPVSRDGLPNFDYRSWVKPESVAKVIGFLMSDDAGDVTGATLPVYGKL